MAYKSDNVLFKSLTDEQETEFRQWAQENDPDDLNQWEAYHPVIREEWEKRGIHKTPGNILSVMSEAESTAAADAGKIKRARDDADWRENNP